MLTGLPKTVILSSEEVRRALEEPVGQIIDAIKSTLDKTPPELAADIMDRGIVLAGGGALLTGLDERLRHETQMPVHLAEIAAHLRRGRLGPQPRGVRGDPPQREGRSKTPQQPPAARSSISRHAAVFPTLGRSVPRNRTARLAVAGVIPFDAPVAARVVLLAGRQPPCKRRIVVGVLVLLSLVLITVYFRESSSGGLHGVQSAGRPCCARSRSPPNRVARPFHDAYNWFAGSGPREVAERSSSGHRSTSCARQAIQNANGQTQNAAASGSVLTTSACRASRRTTRLPSRPPRSSRSRPSEFDQHDRHRRRPSERHPRQRPGRDRPTASSARSRGATRHRAGHAAHRRGQRRLGDRPHQHERERHRRHGQGREDTLASTASRRTSA